MADQEHWEIKYYIGGKPNKDDPNDNFLSIKIYMGIFFAVLIVMTIMKWYEQ